MVAVDNSKHAEHTVTTHRGVHKSGDSYTATVQVDIGLIGAIASGKARMRSACWLAMYVCLPMSITRSLTGNLSTSACKVECLLCQNVPGRLNQAIIGGNRQMQAFRAVVANGQAMYKRPGNMQLAIGEWHWLIADKQ